MVLAKAPAPGRVKTRLCPPCTPESAARIAEAALCDTLQAVSESSCTRRVLVLDGLAGTWLPAGWEVIPQSGGGLGERLDAAFATADAPALLVGMDTPQLEPRDVDTALAALCDPSCDAVLGPAFDGGYWAIGFARQVRGAFTGVPMSTHRTFCVQYERLRTLGLRTRLLPSMRDVDHYQDALAVARLAPATRLAQAVGARTR
jgi:rSAM/selenodomain-associated transferase 1